MGSVLLKKQKTFNQVQKAICKTSSYSDDLSQPITVYTNIYYLLYNIMFSILIIMQT